jgi:hypothetical protein
MNVPMMMNIMSGAKASPFSARSSIITDRSQLSISVFEKRELESSELAVMKNGNTRSIARTALKIYKSSHSDLNLRSLGN